MKILVVDDEEYMRTLINIYLKQYGYSVTEAKDGIEAIKKVKEESYDLVLLDVMMPAKDGWQVCEEIRTFSQVPIIMLTARDDTLDKVYGLNLGADDYITKPFEEVELMARIDAVIRRSRLRQPEQEEEEILQYKGIKIIVDAHEVYYEGEEIKLTPREFDLLYLLMLNKGKVMSREQLLEKIWGLDYLGEHRTVDSHVKNLREKLRRAGIHSDELIQTIWGIGYKLV